MLKNGTQQIEDFAGFFDSRIRGLVMASKLDLVAGTAFELEFTYFCSSTANKIEALSGSECILFIRNLPARRRCGGIFWQ